MGVATLSDPLELYMNVHSSPDPVLTIGILGEVDGVPAGIGGIALHPCGQWVAFALLGEVARKHPVTLQRAAKQIIKIAKERGIKQLVAVANTEEGGEAAERWLLKLKFKKGHDSIGEDAFVLELT